MKTKKINITFALPNLLPGGAERVFSYIAENINQEKFNATLLIVGYSKDASYDVKNANIVFLEKERVQDGIFGLWRYMRVNKPDVMVSAVGHLNSVMALFSFAFPKIKFISREVTVLSLDASFFETNGSKFSLHAFFGKRRFKYFDKIICQSQDMLEDIKQSYDVDADKMIVINNPITDSFKLKERSIRNSVVQYITVGRLSKEKGYERILKLLSKLEFPFHYTIIGNGSERAHIFSKIEEYGLTEKVTHIEFTKEISKYLSMSDIFLQGSYYEGFPNCLIESCSVGTPVLAFKAPGGTKEIIEHGVNGYIVDDEEAYFDKLHDNTHWDPAKVRQSVLKKFNSDLILHQYEDLFINIVK